MSCPKHETLQEYAKGPSEGNISLADVRRIKKHLKQDDCGECDRFVKEQIGFLHSDSFDEWTNVDETVNS